MYNPPKALFDDSCMRAFRRVEISLSGRFMRENGEENPCTTQDVSPGGVFLLALPPSSIPQKNEKIIIYLETLGRLEGRAIRQNEHGFAVTIEGSRRQRHKIATNLTWLINKSALALKDQRIENRHNANGEKVQIMTQEGETLSGKLIDVSLSGAFVRIHKVFDVGNMVLINNTPGRIVRTTTEGIGVNFMRTPNNDAFLFMTEKPQSAPASA